MKQCKSELHQYAGNMREVCGQLNHVKEEKARVLSESKQLTKRVDSLLADAKRKEDDNELLRLQVRKTRMCVCICFMFIRICSVHIRMTLCLYITHTLRIGSMPQCIHTLFICTFYQYMYTYVYISITHIHIHLVKVHLVLLFFTCMYGCLE